jgi:alkaline phosphatase
MTRIWIAVIAFSFLSFAEAQTYTSSRIFAHNDYAQSAPFYTAYDMHVGFIEADVFLVDSELLVAHHKHEIQKEKTLALLYLKPLLDAVKRNNGFVYQDPAQTLTLMIDLKTEGVPTLRALTDHLEKYPELLSCTTLQFMISGNVPDPLQWTDYPPYIYFDGRPGIHYTNEQLKRVSMISTNFRDHAKWNGNGKLADEEEKKLRILMDDAHSRGKKMRFWATPDFEAAWKELMRLKVDVIVTDNVTALAHFVNLKK